jgi:dihydroorotase
MTTNAGMKSTVTTDAVATDYVIKGVRPLGGDPVDLYLSGGRLAAEPAAGATVIDADGLIALPGLVDLHTHLREPGREDAETILTGTRAAAAGGFTAVHAMANTDPVADTAGVVEQVWRLGRAAGYCEVRPVGAVTAGLRGERLAELGAMADSAAGVRVFSDDGHCVTSSALMRRAL